MRLHPWLKLFQALRHFIDSTIWSASWTHYNKVEKWNNCPTGWGTFLDRTIPKDDPQFMLPQFITYVSMLLHARPHRLLCLRNMASVSTVLLLESSRHSRTFATSKDENSWTQSTFHMWHSEKSLQDITMVQVSGITSPPDLFCAFRRSVVSSIGTNSANSWPG